MFKGCVTAILILALAYLAQPASFAAQSQKPCCCTHSLTKHCSSCAQTGNDCCPTAAPTPSPVLDVPQKFAFEHPPKILTVSNFTTRLDARSDKPLLPPPKEV